MKTDRVLYSIIIILFLLSVSGACSFKETNTAEFQSEEDSPIQIKFSYPKNWEWKVWVGSDKKFYVIYADNPYPANDLKKTGRLISIAVNLNSPQETMQESMDLLLRDISTLPVFELLNDQVIQINGYDARWITHKRNPNFSQGETQPYIVETIYLLAEDRYYKISLNILEEEINGKFHNEFKAMVESIKFLP